MLARPVETAQRNSGSSSAENRLLASLIYLVAYLALEFISMVGLYRGIGVTPWSPAAGLALSFAYFGDYRLWAALFIAPLLATLLIHPLPMPLASVIVIVLASGASWLLAGRAMHLFPAFDPSFRSVRSVLILIAVSAIAAAVQTTFYIGTLYLAGQLSEPVIVPAAWRYLVGGLVGALVVTPLLLMIARHRPWPSLDRIHIVQGVALLGALYVVFGLVDATTYQLFYLLFIPILWVALRDGSTGAAVVLNLCQLGIIVGAHFRYGLIPGIGALQILMIVLVVTGLLVGVAVTERQLASQRLRDQQAALNRALRLRSAGETAAAIAHQLNQPLTAISTYAMIASEALAGGDAQTATATMAKLTAECDRAATVLKSTRDLVKLGGLTRTTVDLRSMLDELVEIIALECDAARIDLRLNVGNVPQTAVCDRTQIQQALYNLVNNSIEAIRHSRRPGRITIAARLEGSDIVLEVIDDGPGFAPGLEDLATTPFISTKENGSGLGLAIARSVAEAHGGSLAILAGGNGARVQLKLPTAQRIDHQGGNL